MYVKYRKPNALDFLATTEFAEQIELWASKTFPGYSRRTFAKWAGVASPNFMTLVLDGKRPLRGAWLDGFCKAAQLPADQCAHLKALSDFEATRDPRKRKEMLDKIHQSLAKLNARSLAQDQLDTLTHPLAWTILQMLDLKDQTGSPIWFKHRLRSRTAGAEVADALALLKRLGLTQTKGGKIRPLQKIVQSPDQVKRSSNALYHGNVLREAISMLDEVETTERAYGSLTVTVQKDKIEQLKSEVNKFGQYLLSNYASSEPVDGEVLRLNIQLYPLTSKSENSDA